MRYEGRVTVKRDNQISESERLEHLNKAANILMRGYRRSAAETADGVKNMEYYH